MRRWGFWANNFIFSFVLKCCVKNTDLKLGVNVHSLIVKEGFEYDACVNTGLVEFYSKLECLDDARKVFDEMPERNVVSLVGVMSGYVGTGRFKKAVDLFRESLEEGLKPDSYTLVRALSACSELGDLVAGEWIHKYILDVDMGRNVFVNTALVDMYAKCGHMENARVIFNGMHERDVVTWGTMVQGYAARGFSKEALEIFHIMRREN
ncbi:hypothetical protein C2S53_003231 [Perilla frutescens var. hirtella]|uniref:Pentatricopeptide repeat-containing protein n=1 Tax=Perilla frutescens var. hirtella TaxID=608512 RepID=A0AAD4JLV5_PERFH|nr:hypothetical protein C2S53_003231 [Perilla frutescens var. hirtella]